MENIGNLRIVHSDCIENAREQFQKENPELSLRNSSHVKIKFTDGEHNEWMWIRVETHNDKERGGLGYLDSVPAFVTNISDSELIPFKYDQILTVL